MLIDYTSVCYMELKKSMKFAIIRRNGLGDFISATVPVCKYIKDKYPNSELHMFLSEQNSVLAKYFFPKDFVYVFHSGNKYFETLKAAVIHRDISPDVGIAPSPSYNKLNGPFLKLLGAKEIYGIKEEVPSFADRFFTKLVNVSYEDHVGLQNIRLFEENINALPEKYYPRFDKSFIRDCVIELPAMRKVIVELSNRRKTSQLTNNKLASVLNSIGKQLDFSVIISLVEKDKQRALDLQKLLNMPTKIVLTKTIDDYVSLLNQADFFLFGDGGAPISLAL